MSRAMFRVDVDESKHNEKNNQHLKDLVTKKVTNRCDDSEWLSGNFSWPQNHEAYVRS